MESLIFDFFLIKLKTLIQAPENSSQNYVKMMTSFKEAWQLLLL